MFTMILLPILQALSCIATIWGVTHIPNVTDTVITYGATGDDAPDLPMWINSFGSLIFGIVSFAATQIAKRKFGFSSDLYKGVIEYITHPSDKLAAVRLFLASLQMFAKTIPDTQENREALAYISSWVTTQYVGQAITIPSHPLPPTIQTPSP